MSIHYLRTHTGSGPILAAGTLYFLFRLGIPEFDLPSERKIDPDLRSNLIWTS